ncbi:MAG TPA: response regulator [Ktedonobacteraceae bacterium]|jgi:DNA-binding response OmpR family regulator|nr:response regulator [Ktedonobacteraceae bacterium]
MAQLLTRTRTALILIVEDDFATGEVLALAISQETSYRSRLVATGREALQFVQQVKPGLIILDYRLPDMTGVALYDQMQTNEALKMIPVVLMSAIDRSDEVALRDITLINKPFDLDDFLTTIERLVAGCTTSHLP